MKCPKCKGTFRPVDMPFFHLRCDGCGMTHAWKSGPKNYKKPRAKRGAYKRR